jgi:glutamate synthase (NADPH) small chain
MAKPTGFIEYPRENAEKRPIEERIKDYREIEKMMQTDALEIQAARCMDCGIPYCHSFGCPLHNRIPDFNDMIYKKKWRKALDILHSTNNFPEITGRVCPALCEAACTLSINMEPVAIRQLELQLVERGWNDGWIVPESATKKTGKKVAIVGSGPSGLAAAQQLARNGHEIIVFEKDYLPGGLLRYGIPDFKMGKLILDRRLDQMKAEGVIFETGVEAGKDISVRYLQRMFDAILITAGAREPRDLKIAGRELNGIYYAMDFLSQQNCRLNGDVIKSEYEIIASGKDVVVIGGGDTGSDCVGTAIRQGAKSVTQIELLPKPPAGRTVYNPWPTWPIIMRTSSSHEEGCDRLWSIQTKEFIGRNGQVEKLHCMRLDWQEPDTNGRRTFKEISGSEFEIKSDFVLLAMGFIHVEHGSLVKDLGIELDKHGNLKVDSNWMTSSKGIFAAGDAVVGASLVVRAIEYGRHAAEKINNYLESK